MKLRTALKGAAAPLAFTIALAAQPVLAQDAAEEPVITDTDTVAEGEGTIFVTGSRIRQNPLDASRPVLNVDSEAIERSGISNIGEILQRIPGSGGGLNSKVNSSGNFGNPPDGGGVGAGASEIDLRFLGSRRVLVLVDGLRWVEAFAAV